MFACMYVCYICKCLPEGAILKAQTNGKGIYILYMYLFVPLKLLLLEGILSLMWMLSMKCIIGYCG